jgi:hypothetical protein
LDPKALRLAVVPADDFEAGLLLPEAPGEGEILAEGDGKDAFFFDGLPRGRLQLLAICRSTGSVAGSIPFTIEDRQGFRAGVGLTRVDTVDLAVDLAYCED